MVLVTRPVAEARETALRLERLGWRPVVAPVMRIVPRTLLLDPAWHPQAVLVTSGNALPAIPEALRPIRLLAVGDATAARARALGFGRTLSAAGDAAALVDLAARQCEPAAGPLLVACGAGQGGALCAGLRARGFRVVRRVAYATLPVRVLPDDGRRALEDGAVAAALFFSAASARAFVGAVRRGRAGATVGSVAALAISQSVARELAPLPWACIRVASRPNQDELLACLS